MRWGEEGMVKVAGLESLKCPEDSPHSGNGQSKKRFPYRNGRKAGKTQHPLEMRMEIRVRCFQKVKEDES